LAGELRAIAAAQSGIGEGGELGTGALKGAVDQHAVGLALIDGDHDGVVAEGGGEGGGVPDGGFHLFTESAPVAAVEEGEDVAAGGFGGGEGGGEVGGAGGTGDGGG